MNNLVKKQNQNSKNYSPKIPTLANMLEHARIDIEYPSDFILSNKSPEFSPEIKHLGPAYVGFANAFAYFLNYTGQGYGYIFDNDWCRDRSYTIADVISGNAMQPVDFSTQPADVVTQEGIEYLWNTAGFHFHHTFCADSSCDSYLNEADMKNIIKYSLCTLGQPVIMPQDYIEFFGSIIVGYKDDGNILLAYYYEPYFKDMQDNTKAKITEISNWYNKNTSMFIAGKRREILSAKEIYRKGIIRIYECLNSNFNGEKTHYYDEWEEFLRLSKNGMLDEARRIGYVPGGEYAKVDESDNDEKAWNIICRSYNNTWCNMAERRYYVMHFLKQSEEYFPGLHDELQELASHFNYASSIMSNKETGYNSEIGDPVKPEVLENQEIRMRMADCVRRFRDADKTALNMVKTLLNKLD